MAVLLVIGCAGCGRPADCTVCAALRARRRRGLRLLECDRCRGPLPAGAIDLCAGCEPLWEAERPDRRRTWARAGATTGEPAQPVGAR